MGPRADMSGANESWPQLFASELYSQLTLAWSHLKWRLSRSHELKAQCHEALAWCPPKAGARSRASGPSLKAQVTKYIYIYNIPTPGKGYGSLSSRKISF